MVSVGKIVMENKLLKLYGMIGTTVLKHKMVLIELNVCHVDKLVVLNTHSSSLNVALVLVMMKIFQTSMTYQLILLVLHLVILIKIVLGVLILKLLIVGLQV